MASELRSARIVLPRAGLWYGSIRMSAHHFPEQTCEFSKAVVVEAIDGPTIGAAIRVMRLEIRVPDRGPRTAVEFVLWEEIP